VEHPRFRGDKGLATVAVPEPGSSIAVCGNSPSTCLVLLAVALRRHRSLDHGLDRCRVERAGASLLRRRPLVIIEGTLPDLDAARWSCRAARADNRWWWQCCHGRASSEPRAVWRPDLLHGSRGRAAASEVTRQP